jgi:hypothetical protein
MHIVIQPNCLISIKVVTLGSKNQNGREFWVAIQRLNALDDVTKVDIEGLASNNYLPAFKAWPRG